MSENTAAKGFKKEIDSIPAEDPGRVEDFACRKTSTLLAAFRAVVTADIVAEHRAAGV